MFKKGFALLSACRAGLVTVAWTAFTLTGAPAHAAASEVGVTNDTILIGQSSAMSGPLAELGKDLVTGEKAYFDYINAQGGIHGRQIKLIALDDGYATQQAIDNAKKLIEKEKVFALIGLFGTPANTSVMPLITEAGVPSVAPYTGSQVVRAPMNRLVFNIRAGYEQELATIANHLAIRGLRNVAVVYQDNAFGKEGLAGIEAAMKRMNRTLAASVAIANDGSDAQAAASTLLKSDPQAIVMITAGKVSSAFIKAYKEKGQTQFVALSVMGSQAAIDAIGKDGIGMVVSQVAPYPFSATSEIVQEYEKVMRKAGVKSHSFATSEGFVNAKVMVEALRRAGRDLTRERFIKAMESMEKVDLGGYDVDFGPKKRQGSNFVDLTVIGRNGRFVR